MSLDWSACSSLTWGHRSGLCASSGRLQPPGVCSLGKPHRDSVKAPVVPMARPSGSLGLGGGPRKQGLGGGPHLRCSCSSLERLLMSARAQVMRSLGSFGCSQGTDVKVQAGSQLAERQRFVRDPGSQSRASTGTPSQEGLF